MTAIASFHTRVRIWPHSRGCNREEYRKVIGRRTTNDDDASKGPKVIHYILITYLDKKSEYSREQDRKNIRRRHHHRSLSSHRRPLPVCAPSLTPGGPNHQAKRKGRTLLDRGSKAFDQKNRLDVRGSVNRFLAFSLLFVT